MAKKNNDEVKDLLDELFGGESFVLTLEDGEEIEIGEDDEELLTDDELKGLAKMEEIKKYHTKKKE